MSREDKINMIKTFLGESDVLDSELGVYLEAAKTEILSWLYSLVEMPEGVLDIPLKYEMTQVQAVVNGYSIRGAEGQRSHSENGINRVFRYTDMVHYIRANVVPYAKVV